MTRRLFELFTSSQKTSATSIYKQQQSNLLIPNNLFPWLQLNWGLNKLKTQEICNVIYQSFAINLMDLLNLNLNLEKFNKRHSV